MKDPIRITGCYDCIFVAEETSGEYDLDTDLFSCFECKFPESRNEMFGQNVAGEMEARDCPDECPLRTYDLVFEDVD